MDDLAARPSQVLPAPGGAYSLVRKTRDLVFVAGQVGTDPTTGQLVPELGGQVRQALTNLDAVLRSVDVTLASIVKVTCFLADIDDFTEFDAVYSSIMPQPFPARSTVGVRLAGGLRVEIEAVAVRALSDVPEPPR